MRRVTMRRVTMRHVTMPRAKMPNVTMPRVTLGSKLYFEEDEQPHCILHWAIGALYSLQYSLQTTVMRIVAVHSYIFCMLLGTAHKGPTAFVEIYKSTIYPDHRSAF